MNNRLNGNECDEEFLIEMGFTTEEIARVKAIKARPREISGRPLEGVPRSLHDFNTTQKKLFALVFGEELAISNFGFGSWIQTKARRRKAKERQG